tara:strand:+ start:1312 stop:2043 length:732 start_codon:yes stop_codon:yes gene_type:complete
MTSMSIDNLYNPDGKQLGSIVAGLSGSGKTTMILSTLQKAIKSPSMGEFHRFVIIDPKRQRGDYDILGEPVNDLSKMFKSIRKNRVSVFWPNIESFEFDVENIVEYMFDLSDSDERISFTFVLDEASILITPTKIPLSLKKLSLQGRAKRIKPVFISQRPIINRWTDANLSNMYLFNTLPVDYDTLSKRWGVDFVQNGEGLREVDYSFMWFNMEKASFKMMHPVELPKPPRKKKKGRWFNLFN